MYILSRVTDYDVCMSMCECESEAGGNCTSLKLTALRIEDKFLALSILATKM